MNINKKKIILIGNLSFLQLYEQILIIRKFH